MVSYRKALSVILFAWALPSAVLAETNDWSGAEKVFLVLPLRCDQPEMGRQVADAIQIRLRDELKNIQSTDYVLSWAEMEIFLGQSPDSDYSHLKEATEKLELTKTQRLVVLTGLLAHVSESHWRAHLAVRWWPPPIPALDPFKDVDINDERWKPMLSIEAVNFLLKEVLGREIKSPPVTTRPAHWRPSIVINGDFIAGKGFTPKGWDQTDNLCSHWIKSGKESYLLFDTDVSQDQAWDWWKALKQGAKPADAPKPIRTDPPHYDAVGGIEGVKLYSDYLPAAAGKTYRLTARVRGPANGNVNMFVKAYALLPSAKSDNLTRREVWQTYLHCIIQNEDWKTYETVFTLPEKLPPVEKKNAKGQLKTFQPKIQWLRVMPFAYWVVGKYCIDDVTLCPAR